MTREQDDRQTAIDLVHRTRSRPVPLGDWAMPVKRSSYSACKRGPCEQGRKLCPTPMACRLAEGETGRWSQFLARVLNIFRSRT